jgi:CheY-like chemotaxis protein
MASIVVFEPHPDVRELLVRVVRRLGHEAHVDDGRPAAEWERVDAVVVEPAPDGKVDTVAAMVREHGAALVCVSIYPPSPAVAALGPVAHLQKPFSVAELEDALGAALA